MYPNNDTDEAFDFETGLFSHPQVPRGNKPTNEMFRR
jgi:hypothetical protein